MRIGHYGGAMKRLRRARRSDRRPRGQALVEFALVFPIALLILLAIFDAGRLVFVYNGLTNAAREGARLAIVNQDKGSVVQRVQDSAFGAGISNAGTPNDVISFYKSVPNGADPTLNPQCVTTNVVSTTTMGTGCVAVVTARFNWTALTPIVGSVIGPISLMARSEIPVEFVCPNPRYAAYASASSCPKQP